MRPLSGCRALAVLLLICAPARAALVQAPLAPMPFRITLKVSADPALKPVVQKALEEALKALPDVQVSDGISDYTVSVIALKVVNRSRRDIGATFSVLVTQALQDRVQEFAALYVPPEHRQELLAMVSKAVTPLAHWVETAAAADIPKVCRGIVESLERDVLRERRKLPSASDQSGFL